MHEKHVTHDTPKSPTHFATDKRGVKAKHVVKTYRLIHIMLIKIIMSTVIKNDSEQIHNYIENAFKKRNDFLDRPVTA